MRTPPRCPSCDDFHWLPDGHGPGWAQRDWRPILEPDLTWRPCPDCGELQFRQALSESLGRFLIARLDEDVRWAPGLRASWRFGCLPSGQPVWRWHDLACVPPGPDQTGSGWLLISPLGGVARDLSAEALRRMLEEMGASWPDQG